MATVKERGRVVSNTSWSSKFLCLFVCFFLNFWYGLIVVGMVFPQARWNDMESGVQMCFRHPQCYMGNYVKYAHNSSDSLRSLCWNWMECVQRKAYARTLFHLSLLLVVLQFRSLTTFSLDFLSSLYAYHNKLCRLIVVTKADPIYTDICASKRNPPSHHHSIGSRDL